MTITPVSPELWATFSASFKEGLSFIASKVAEKEHLPSHSSWPTLSWLDNGMPSLSSSSSDCPTDYTRLFHDGWFSVLAGKTDDTPKFDALISFFRSDIRLAAYFPEALINSVVKILIESAIDRYIHVFNTLEEDKEKVLQVYQPLESWLLQELLRTTLYIPILFTRLDTEEYKVADGISIQRMSDAMQLARAPNTQYLYGHHPFVQSGATHAFVLDGYTVKNSTLPEYFNPEATFPKAEIDLLFASLRIVTEVETGYAQILTAPVGWASFYNGSLMPLRISSQKAYPYRFDEGAWNMESTPVIGVDKLQTLCEVFNNLKALDRNGTKIALAIRKLNQAYLRDDDHDSILDITTGMEAILSDSNEEITHKLALRLAALVSYVGNNELSAHQLFKEVKAIYKFRSAIIHGDGKASEKTAVYKRQGVLEIPTIALGLTHFKSLLLAISRYLKFLDASVIDEELLLNIRSATSSAASN